MQKVSLEYASPESSAGFLKNLPFYLNKVKDLKTNSLVEYTKFTRVEPIVLYDESLQSQPYMTNVMQSLVNIFAGYYLQAVAISCNVGNIEVQKLLGKLSPDRTRDFPMDIARSDLLSYRFNQGIEAIATEQRLAPGTDPSEYDKYALKERDIELKESDSAYRRRKDRRDDRRKDKEAKYKRGRDYIEDVRKDEETKYKRGRDIIDDFRKDTEAKYKRGRDDIEDQRRDREHEYRKGRDTIGDKQREQERNESRLRDKELYREREEERLYKRQRDKEDDERRSKQIISASKSSIDDLNTNVNLSAGKTISIEIESDGSKAIIPINIRLIVKISPSNALVNFLTVIKSDRSVRGRWQRWRAKEISFFKDLLLCQDIIDEEKKAHFSDKEGIFRNLRNRNRSKSDTIYDIITDNINVASASSIIVMSKETALQVERAMLGKIDNFRVREKLFQITYSMLLLVIDTRWEMITIYHRSIAEPSMLSVREISNTTRDKGPDINEILMSLRAGTAPTF